MCSFPRLSHIHAKPRLMFCFKDGSAAANIMAGCFICLVRGSLFFLLDAFPASSPSLFKLPFPLLRRVVASSPVFSFHFSPSPHPRTCLACLFFLVSPPPVLPRPASTYFVIRPLRLPPSHIVFVCLTFLVLFTQQYCTVVLNINTGSLLCWNLLVCLVMTVIFTRTQH